MRAKRYPACFALYLLLSLLFLPATNLDWNIPGLSTCFAEQLENTSYWVSRFGLAGETPLVRRAKTIFQRVLAVSDKRLGVEPELFVVDTSRKVASSYPSGEVIISVGTLDMCYEDGELSLGDAKIAFIFGHELAHLVSDHFWCSKFFSQLSCEGSTDPYCVELEVLSRMPESVMSTEVQADQRGILYALLAGYDSYRILRDETFFREWVEDEEAGAGAEGAWEAQVRIRVGKLRRYLRTIVDKVALFRFGVVSYSLGRYDEAEALFKRFSLYFPSREVYTNLGAVYLRRAYEAFISGRTEYSFPFRLVFGLEPTTRAEGIALSREFSEEKYRLYKKNINEALKYFLGGLRAGEGSPELLNSLGCTYIMEGKYHLSTSYLQEALDLDPENDAVRNNLAVSYAMLGETLNDGRLILKARKYLMSIRDKNPVYERNLRALEFLSGKSRRLAKIADEPHMRNEVQKSYFFQIEYPDELTPGRETKNLGGFEPVDVFRVKSGDVYEVIADGKSGVQVFLINGVVRCYMKPVSVNIGSRKAANGKILLSERTRCGILRGEGGSIYGFVY